MSITPAQFNRLMAKVAPAPRRDNALLVAQLSDGQGCVEKRWTVPGAPVGAVRMTRRDKWLNPRRDCVQRYFDYRDRIKAVVGSVEIPDECHCVFWLPMPESWSKTKQAKLLHKPCRQKPDIDNMFKGVMDSLFEHDAEIWKGSQEKFWAKPEDARTEIKMIWLGI